MLKRLASSCYSSGTYRLHKCVQQLQPTAVETAIKGPNPPQLAEMPSSLRGAPLMPLNMLPEDAKGGPGHHQSRAYAYQASRLATCTNLASPPSCSVPQPVLWETKRTPLCMLQLSHKLWRGSQCFSSAAHDAGVSHSAPTAQGMRHNGDKGIERIVLYRGRGMVPFRVLVRLKIFQLAGVAALAIPINTFLVEVCRYLFLPPTG